MVVWVTSQEVPVPGAMVQLVDSAGRDIPCEFRPCVTDASGRVEFPRVAIGWMLRGRVDVVGYTSAWWMLSPTNRMPDLQIRLTKF